MGVAERLSIERLCHSDTAVRNSIPNVPDANQRLNLLKMQEQLMVVERILGVPLWVTSCFRGPKLNAKIGGSKSSDHMNGLATDFVAPDFGSPYEICIKLKNELLHFDQLIYEGTWVHLGIGPRMRRELLTARFSKNAIGLKVTTYEKGINR